jgi:hypothetical protein
MDMPVNGRRFSIACSIGAGPRRSGSSEGCTFRPPYWARFRIRGGTKRPKETAIMRLMGVGGVQPVKVSTAWVGRFSSSVATCLMGTVYGQFMPSMYTCMVGVSIYPPSLNFFSPRPVGFAGRWSTWMLSIRPGSS